MLSAVRFDHRIACLELRAGLPIGELPVDARPPGVALALQRAHPPLQGRHVADRAREAAALDDADLDLGLVEPAAVLGRVVELLARQDAAGLLRREGLVER